MQATVVLTVINVEGYMTGLEFKFNPNFRLAPWGNRTGNRYGELPHYHRRGPIDQKSGETISGQGIGNHRPWQGGW